VFLKDRTSSCDPFFSERIHSVSSELKSADLEVEDLSKEILACEKKVYETFLGPKPDVESLQKLLLPDYLYIQSKGVIWTREENIATLKSGVVFRPLKSRIRRSGSFHRLQL
jgi:hypothetical protein